MSLKAIIRELVIFYLIRILFNAHLPSVTFGVGITIEPLEEYEKLAGECVVVVKGYEVLNSVCT